MTTEDVLDSLEAECHQDHVGLWELIHAAQLDLGASDPTTTREVALQLARGLICERGMQVGFPADDGRHFKPWKLTPEQALRRIEDEWIALGREPNIGEVAWFTSEP